MSMQALILISQLFFRIMQQDNLLQQWRKAKDICLQIIAICKKTHLGIGDIQGTVVTSSTKQTPKQFMEVYNIVYKLCITKDRQENRVMMVYKDYSALLKTALLQITPLLMEEKQIYRLSMLRKIWDCYMDIQKRLSNMFAYLNRPFFSKDSGIQNLDKTGSNIIISTLFGQMLVTQYELIYFKQIDKMRRHQQAGQHKILADFVDIFHQIHLKIIKNSTNKRTRTIYTQLYAHYQKITRQYYSKIFRMHQSLSPCEYFQQINRLYHSQKQLAQDCFGIAPDTLFTQQFSQQLLQKYRQILLNSPKGLKHIFRQGLHQTLKTIVQLYLNLTKSLDGFKQQFQSYIYEQMLGFMDQQNGLLSKPSLVNYCTFVDKIIRKNSYLMQVLYSLKSTGDFVAYYMGGVQQAFRQAKLQVPLQQLLAIYTDTKFRLQLQQPVFQSEVKSIITLFNCAQNKDVFLIKYSQRIARRILVFTQGSLRRHEVFISNLKLNCGIKDTQRLQTILMEYRISSQNHQLLSDIQVRQKLPYALSLKVFGQGVWPTKHIVQLPNELMMMSLGLGKKCIDLYVSEHLSKKVIRISALQSKVRWVYYFDQVGQEQGSCYLDTNCLQAVLLYYVYSQRPHPVSLETLEGLLPNNSKIIQQSLNKMSQSKQKILLKDSQHNLYRFNQQLKPSKKLITYDQGNNQQQDKTTNQADLVKDRQIVLDANICKLMKSRKIIDFGLLMEEVIKMVRVFVPTNKDIKLAVQRLIGKDILLRDEKDHQIVRYKD